MRRFPRITLGLTFMSVALLALASCGGGSPANGGTTQIVLSLSNSNVVQGGYVVLSATPEDASGNVITKVTPTFSVTSGGDLVSVSVNGLICAGQWDSLVTPTRCTPYDSTKVGDATVQASVGTGVGSVTASATVSVVPPIDNLTLTAAPVSSDPAGLDCVSQFATRNYTVSASLHGTHQALNPGAVTWTLANSSIGTAAANGSDSNGNAIGTVTAAGPGKTVVMATVGSLQSQPQDFMTCPVSQITLADSAAPATSMPITSPTSITLTPNVIDSRGKPLTLFSTDSSGNVTTLISLNWTSSRSTAASVSSGVITPGTSGGTTAIVASCTPPSCNYNLDRGGAVYSKPFITSVAATSSPAAKTVYVGSKAPAPDSSTTAPGLSLIPIPTSTNTPGTAITLPAIPNSMMFAPSGTTLYMGTGSGLISVSTASNTVAGPVVGTAGKVLAVSPDSSTILVSDASIVAAGSASHVYFVNSGGTVQTFNINGVTGAAFAPDSSKAYLVGNNQLTVSSTAAYPVSQQLPEATDATFLASGAFGLVGAGSGLNLYPTCSTSFQATASATVDLGSPSALMSPLPDGVHVISVNPSASPGVILVTIPTDNKAFVSETLGCISTLQTIPTPAEASFSGVSSFSANQLIVSSDGTRVFILSDQGQLLSVNISGNSVTAAPIAISGNVAQTTGGITVDGKLLYFGGVDNKIHNIDLTTNTEKTPIAIATPTGFTTDFVAVQP
jgi:trimeric autotransporter adhesin